MSSPGFDVLKVAGNRWHRTRNNNKKRLGKTVLEPWVAHQSMKRPGPGTQTTRWITLTDWLTDFFLHSLNNNLRQVAFFNADKNFIKSKEHGSGNTALHLACRHGHYVSRALVTVKHRLHSIKLSLILTSLKSIFQFLTNQKISLKGGEVKVVTCL